LATRGYVLQTGRLILEGYTIDLLSNERVKETYLGEKQ
jgi:ABC-type lipopolysaccharide export system ATPase subunit